MNSKAKANKNLAVAKKSVYSVYLRSLLTTKITLHVTEIGKQLIENLHKKLILKVSGKCIEEGFCSSNNIKIIQHSAGSVFSENITYHVSYECNICFPTEGQTIIGKVKSSTKAGLHCQVVDLDGTIPITAFVARDHNFNNVIFHEAKENDIVILNVIGIRFELNDPFICVIANIVSIEEIKGQKGGAEKIDNKYFDGNKVVDDEVYDVDDNDTVLDNPPSGFTDDNNMNGYYGGKQMDVMDITL
jgi:DNA-directed RNA polymerase subunit E'/Rpb7